MSKIEELTALSLLADAEADAQKVILRDLNLELERTGDTLEPLDYGNLRTRIEHQQMRAKSASRIACTRRLELDETRAKESARLTREMTERAYQGKLAELNSCRAEAASKRQAITQLQNELPVIEQRQNILLFELDRAKTALSALEREKVTT